MEDKNCPACRAANEDDARYCDQCGQPLTEPENAADASGDGCPACGGEVESRAGGKGVCRRCGLELVEEDDGTPVRTADAGTVARLTAAISRGVGAGLPLERAVADACREIFPPQPDTTAPASAPDETSEPMNCPLCGAENPADAQKCAGCGLWFAEPRAAQPCPRCAQDARGGKCACGAILTLPQLLEYVDPSVRFVCSRCKQPYAVLQPKCPDCGGGLLSAERLKAYAAS